MIWQLSFPQFLAWQKDPLIPATLSSTAGSSGSHQSVIPDHEECHLHPGIRTLNMSISLLIKWIPIPQPRVDLLSTDGISPLAWFSTCRNAQGSQRCYHRIFKAGDVQTPAANPTGFQALSKSSLLSQEKRLPRCTSPARSCRSNISKISVTQRLHFSLSNSAQICEIPAPRHLKFWAI